MKALQWDLMTVRQRYLVLSLWDCEDFGGKAALVELGWENLPPEFQTILKMMRA